MAAVVVVLSGVLCGELNDRGWTCPSSTQRQHHCTRTTSWRAQMPPRTRAAHPQPLETCCCGERACLSGCRGNRRAWRTTHRIVQHLRCFERHSEISGHAPWKQIPTRAPSPSPWEGRRPTTPKLDRRQLEKKTTSCTWPERVDKSNFASSRPLPFQSLRQNKFCTTRDRAPPPPPPPPGELLVYSRKPRGDSGG